MYNPHNWESEEIITADKLNHIETGVQDTDLSNYVTEISVKSFGAVGDGINDDTSAIQNALNSLQSVGGTLFFPQGNYKITDTLRVYEGTTIQGSGIGGRSGDYQDDPSKENAKPGTNIIQTTANKDGIANATPTAYNIQLFDFILTGTGSGTGNGINFDWALGNQNSNGRLSHLTFKRLFITDFGANGMRLRTPILTTIEQVHSQRNGGNGFEVIQNGFGNSFINTWATGNVIGYHISGVMYNHFSGTAADYNNIGYSIEGCQSVTFSGIGAERQLTRAINVINSNNINLFGIGVVGNNDIAIWIDHDCYSINIMGGADNSVNPTAKEFIHAEYGAQVVISNVMTSAQAPNNYEDYSYVTQLVNPKGYFQVSPHKGIVNGQGATANRPAGQTGLQWFDTTIGKPIWYNGTTWVDATGETV